MMLYLPTENFFSKTLLILYHPRITQEPSIMSKKPTMKPNKAGLKSMAIPNTRQKVQKSTINREKGNEAYCYANSLEKATIFSIKKPGIPLAFDV